MGRVTNGANGPISGKVGSVVFCKWKGIDYVRGLPRINKNRKPTKSQAKQRSKFSFMQEKLKPIVPLVRLGFMNYATNRTGHNSAMSYNLKEAVLETTDGYELDYEKFCFSKGILPPPEGVQVEQKNKKLYISWKNTSIDSKLNRNRTMLLLYPEDRLTFAEAKQFGNCRFELHDEIALPAGLKIGTKLHLYLSFFATDGSNNSSDSVYAGVIEIQ
ncbi:MULTISPECIES: DUF6266 family protein [Olivibacter]|uniref:Uncharacterized protein n=2 Tax=Sphingobacteriaceae TaxID=84566 RepID=F4C6R1_SPHS2|nr:DUF6266 family protein [Olivibacter sp. UJ_SKK_5.1]MDX3912519.1 DUF6266 family protein [Pseudosphingobacterium sp.]